LRFERDVIGLGWEIELGEKRGEEKWEMTDGVRRYSEGY
jgi:hypothetical protein